MGDNQMSTHEELLKEKERLLEEVKTNPEVLRDASEGLRNDKEVVLEAVKQDRWVLEYASKELQNDKEILSLI